MRSEVLFSYCYSPNFLWKLGLTVENIHPNLVCTSYTGFEQDSQVGVHHGGIYVVLCHVQHVLWLWSHVCIFVLAIWGIFHSSIRVCWYICPESAVKIWKISHEQDNVMLSRQVDYNVCEYYSSAKIIVCLGKLCWLSICIKRANKFSFWVMI